MHINTFRGRKSNNHIECNFSFINLDKFETHMKKKHYSSNWSKVTLEISTKPSHVTRNGLKQEKFICYQCNFTFSIYTWRDDLTWSVLDITLTDPAAKGKLDHSFLTTFTTLYLVSQWRHTIPSHKCQKENLK